MAQRADASCHFLIEPDVQVRADAQRLRQVFGNLFENASRHRGAGLALTLSAACAGQTVRIRVDDNGPGIAPDDQPRVFERFYRAEKSRNRTSGGAGLGLAIAKAIVEAMDGRIRLVPEHQGGAMFEIELPRAGDPESGRGAASG
jgi:two-component system sensor histidine kinase BaeS